jgi:tetratricopeptide (TPR) repeat protein
MTFTRAERRLLAKLTASPGVVVSRDSLLDAISGVGSDANDRSIDFLVTRLRRKLGDRARDPAFIATRYGEGYVWVARPVASESRASGAFIVVGPVRGLSSSGKAGKAGDRFAQQVVSYLQAHAVPQNKIVFDPDCPSAGAFSGQEPRFQLTLSFLVLRDRGLDCALTLREFVSGRILAVRRQTLLSDGGTSAPDATIGLAGEIIDDVWKALSRGEGEPEGPDLPLAVRLHEAAEALNEVQNGRTWQSTELRLRRALERDPDDPQTRLMLATAIHSKYITSGIAVLADGDPRAADEAEIESLVTASLPGIQSNGILTITAAKLLYFVNAAYRSLAFDLAEQALHSTTAFGNAYTVAAQIRMWQGKLDEALDMYERALEFTGSDAHFRFYILTLKAQALTAKGDAKGARETIAPICRVSPLACRFYGLFYELLPEFDDTGELDAELDQTSPRGASAMLIYLHYVCGRLFEHAEHRRNTMRYTAHLLAGRFGSKIIPAEVRADLPEEFQVAAE